MVQPPCSQTYTGQLQSKRIMRFFKMFGTNCSVSHGSQSHGATAATKSAPALKQMKCLAMSTWVPLSLITCLASVMHCNSKSSALHCTAYVLHCICAALHLRYTSNLLQSCFSQFKCTPSLSLSLTPPCDNSLCGNTGYYSHPNVMKATSSHWGVNKCTSCNV
jgi:hypothetical protein